MKRYSWKLAFKVAWMGCLCLGSGCGALESNDYKGETLLNLHGSITLTESTQLPSKDVHVGLLWMFRKADTGFDMSMLDSVVGADFPLKFGLDIFSSPPESALMSFVDMIPYYEKAKGFDVMGIMNGVAFEELFPEDTTLGAALIVLWEDTNGTDQFEFEFGPNADNETLAEALSHGGPDRIVGGAPKNAIIYIGGQGIKDKLYEIQEAFREQYTENIFYFDPGEKLNPGYNLLQVTSEIVYFPWYAQQFSPVSNNTNVDLVISDDLSLTIPHCCGD